MHSPKIFIYLASSLCLGLTKVLRTPSRVFSRQGHQTPSISEFLLPSSYPMTAPLKSPLTPKFGMAFSSGRSENTVMEQRPSSPPQQPDSKGPPLVGPGDKSHAGPPPGGGAPSSPTLHRRILGGLGSPPQGPQNLGGVGRLRETLPHQPAGDVSCPQGSSPLRTFSSGPEDRPDVQHQHGSSLSQ